jgi:hypothetical protein
MDELDGDMLRVGTRAAIAEHDELSAAVEPLCHRVTRARDVFRMLSQVGKRGGSPGEQLLDARA